MVVMKKIINGNDEDDIDHGELFGDNLSSGKPGIFFVSKHLQRVSSAEEDQDHQHNARNLYSEDILNIHIFIIFIDIQDILNAAHLNTS